MTPLYSKEAKELALSAIWKDDFVCLSNYVKEIEAIDRLVENGNEAMDLLNTIVVVLKGDGYVGLPVVLNDLIKKIKGEG